MKKLWSVYQFACEHCGAWAGEFRIPSNCSVAEYRPVKCRACGSTYFSAREKP